MRKAICFLVVLMTSLSTARAVQTSIPVRVDPRVELMCIVMRIAGCEEYNMPNAKSPYSDEVDKQFGAFKEHKAIKTLIEMRKKYGIGYDAPMSLAVHVDNAKDLNLLIDPKKPPQTFDNRWNPKATQDFLIQLREFVQDSKFEAFIESHREYYEKSAASMKALLSKHKFTEWFDKFYGERKNADLSVTVGLLTGGGNYGMSAQLDENHLVVSPIIGAYQWDEHGVPQFIDNQAFTLIHEFSHTYMNPLVRKNFPKISKSMATLAKVNENQFRSQAYQGGMTIACETMVRLATVLFTQECLDEKTTKLILRNEINSGFWWMDGMVKLFEEYKDRSKYPTLEQFMPRVCDYINTIPKRLPELKARMPQVVSMSPKNGAKGVSVNTTRIEVTYSKPVSLFNAKGLYWKSKKPLEVGTWTISEDKRTISISVRLEPQTEYKFVIYAVQSSEGFFPSTETLSFTTGK